MVQDLCGVENSTHATHDRGHREGVCLTEGWGVSVCAPILQPSTAPTHRDYALARASRCGAGHQRCQTPAECHAAALFALGIWFLLREIELAALLSKHMQISEAESTVTLTLWATKNDPVANLVARVHTCYCGFVEQAMCPYHAALAFQPFVPRDPELPLFGRHDAEPLPKMEVSALIRAILAKNSVPLRRPGPPGSGPVHRFHGHCLRVSGAQMMSRFGVPVSAIMLIGRWGSQAILRYVQEAALEDFDIAGADHVSLVKRQRSQRESDADRSNDGLAARLERLANAVEALQKRPSLVIIRKARVRDCNEAAALPMLWKTKCGLPYGGSAFLRADEPGETPRCKRCFPPEGQSDKQSDTESESSSGQERDLTGDDSSSQSGSSECSSEG